jgi:hypothetical protein
MPKPRSNKLLPLRTAVILLCALLIGTTAGALTYFGAKNLTSATLAGGSAFAGAVLWLDKIIAT